MSNTALAKRQKLPDALRVLLQDYPRDIWESHSNFDGLTRFWLDRHLMFRDTLARWQGDTRAFLDRDMSGQSHAAHTARLGNFLINQLHGHHQIEDAHYFPVLSRAEPRLATGFDLLDSDHHALDEGLTLLAQVATAHLRAVEAEGDARASAGKMLAQLETFGGFLDRHLVDEEDLVVPVILHHALRF